MELNEQLKPMHYHKAKPPR